jgi:DNA-binding transcriptional ArsR family regulator
VTEPLRHHRLDARSLVAIAHPLRLRIRDRLRRHGPATATELARAFGESTGATSYHLRMLARYGLVEPDPDHEHKGRERWWRAVPDIFQIQLSELLDDAAARDALRVVSFELDRLARERLERWLAERERWSQPWRDGAETATAVVRLTVEQMTELRNELSAVIERYLQMPAAAEGRNVEIELNIFPTGEPA